MEILTGTLILIFAGFSIWLARPPKDMIFQYKKDPEFQYGKDKEYYGQVIFQRIELLKSSFLGKIVFVYLISCLIFMVFYVVFRLFLFLKEAIT